MNLTKKTKEMFIDFRRKQLPCGPAPCVIKSEPAAAVECMGDVLTKRIHFDACTDPVCEEANQWLFFSQKLQSFSVDMTLMKILTLLVLFLQFDRYIQRTGGII